MIPSEPSAHVWHSNRSESRLHTVAQQLSASLRAAGSRLSSQSVRDIRLGSIMRISEFTEIPVLGDQYGPRSRPCSVSCTETRGTGNYVQLKPGTPKVQKKDVPTSGR